MSGHRAGASAKARHYKYLLHLTKSDLYIPGAVNLYVHGDALEMTSEVALGQISA